MMVEVAETFKPTDRGPWAYSCPFRPAPNSTNFLSVLSLDKPEILT
jgi:hypothetical protein